MATYNNAFDPHEDRMLWELHEIRHELHPILSQKTIEDINAEAFRKYQQWQNEMAASNVPLKSEQPFVVKHREIGLTMA